MNSLDQHINISMKKVIVIAILTMLLNEKLQAQTGAFRMSSNSHIPNTASSTSAIQFNSDTECIVVQTGVYATTWGEYKRFVINCEIDYDRKNIRIKFYPNPVKNFAKLQFIDTPPLTDKYELNVYDMLGHKISTREESGYNLYQGVTLDFSNLIGSPYVLQIKSGTYVDVIKFIKN